MVEAETQLVYMYVLFLGTRFFSPGTQVFALLKSLLVSNVCVYIVLLT